MLGDRFSQPASFSPPENDGKRSRPLIPDARLRAFTLIELLVVIAIMAILAAILFPVFAKARTRAQSTACQSNLRQLYAAFDLYLDNWEETYPNSWQLDPSAYGDLNHSWWDVQIAPYVKGDGVFSCPSNDTASYSAQQPYNAFGAKTRIVNYALNNQLLHCPPGAYRFSYQGDPGDPATRTELQEPANTILLAEKMMDEPNHAPNPANAHGNQSEEIDVWYHLTGPGLDPLDWNTSWGVARSLHDGGSNFLFADGHVKHLRLQDTFSVTDSTTTVAATAPPTANGASPVGAPLPGAGDTSGAGATRSEVTVDPIMWKLTK